MSQSRRVFLKGAGVALAGLPLTRLPVSAGGHDDEDSASLCKWLATRQARVKSLYVRYTCTGEPAGSADGTYELFFDRNRYRLTQRDDSGGGVFQVFTPQGSICGYERDRVVRSVKRGKSRQWPPGTSLETFLPAPKDLPALFQGDELVTGKRCVGLSQGDRRYWVGQVELDVRRVDFLLNSRQVRVRQEFIGFEEVRQGLRFPREMTTTAFGPDGQLRQRGDIHVEEVEVNEPMSQALFSIEIQGKEV